MRAFLWLPPARRDALEMEDTRALAAQVHLAAHRTVIAHLALVGVAVLGKRGVHILATDVLQSSCRR